METEKVKEELTQMFIVDQEAVLESKAWEEFKNDPNGARKHTQRLKEVIAEFGWPTISKVGPISCSEAWLIVQHSDHDLEFQKEVLEIFKSLPEGEVNRVNIAMLEDRVRMNEGIPQLYGTQWVAKDDKQVPYMLEDPEHVEERRKSMGLDTMADNLRHLQEWSKKASKLRAKNTH